MSRCGTALTIVNVMSAFNDNSQEVCGRMIDQDTLLLQMAKSLEALSTGTSTLKDCLLRTADAHDRAYCHSAAVARALVPVRVVQRANG